MKRSRYTAEQVAFALRQAESGTQVPEVCRKMGITIQAFVTLIHLGQMLPHTDVNRIVVHREKSVSMLPSRLTSQAPERRLS